MSEATAQTVDQKEEEVKQKYIQLCTRAGDIQATMNELHSQLNAVFSEIARLKKEYTESKQQKAEVTSNEAPKA